MNTDRNVVVRMSSTIALVLLMAAANDADAQPGPAHARRGRPGYGTNDSAHRDDMALIHALFTDRTLKRTVREISGGVETITESATEQGAENVRKHVRAMHARLERGAPIHARDPLFAALFAHSKQIVMQFEDTPRGILVRETSRDPHVTKLIRAHAAVVSKFIENGMREMRVNHAVPAPAGP